LLGFMPMPTMMTHQRYVPPWRHCCETLYLSKDFLRLKN
jgi:hypothetical protein